MDEKGRLQGISEEDGTALNLLRRLCYTIGSANDAEDHGYGDEADTWRFLAFGWSEIANEAGALLGGYSGELPQHGTDSPE